MFSGKELKFQAKIRNDAKTKQRVIVHKLYIYKGENKLILFSTLFQLYWSGQYTYPCLPRVSF